MRVLVTGAAGMLGQDLVACLAAAHEVRGVDLADFDVTVAGEVSRFVGEHRPEAVIHAAAYTNVDRAEAEPEVALAVNGKGAENLARACFRTGSRMILISTDFVFDGCKRTPYLESDPPRPLNVYGRSKLEGERLARAALPGLTVVRTAWLYGAGGENFLTRILRAAESRDSLGVVTDETGSPTWTVDLSGALKQLLENGAAGPLYHIAGSGACSRYELAAELFRLLRVESCRLLPVTKSEFSTPAVRPSYSALASERLALDNIEPPRPWRQALKEFVTRMPGRGGGKPAARQ